jgi:hypothetical protein
MSDQHNGPAKCYQSIRIDIYQFDPTPLFAQQAEAG